MSDMRYLVVNFIVVFVEVFYNIDLKNVADI